MNALCDPSVTLVRPGNNHANNDHMGIQHESVLLIQTKRLSYLTYFMS